MNCYRQTVDPVPGCERGYDVYAQSFEAPTKAVLNKHPGPGSHSLGIEESSAHVLHNPQDPHSEEHGITTSKEKIREGKDGEEAGGEISVHARMFPRPQGDNW